MSQKTYKGYFRPKNPNKYAGDLNKIRYLSSWERKVMNWCDNNPNVLKWTSEFPINYYSRVDGKHRRYFVDFIIKKRNSKGIVENIMMEVKPHKEKFEPEKPKNRNQKALKRYLNEMTTYQRNQDKWQSAYAYAKKHGMSFQIGDQYDLGIEKRPCYA